MSTSGARTVTLADVERARGAIRGQVRHTPLVEAPRFPGLPDVPIYLKLENLQRTNSFKVRGATNRIAQLTEAEARKGVIAASAGNHSQGVALAARTRGVPATIVMARTASPMKVAATRALGATVILHGADYDEAHEEAIRRSVGEGLTYIHPFDDPFIIAGQGTVGLEIMEDLPEVRRVIAGVGGGGLVAGIAVAVKGIRPEVDVVGVQPTGSDTLRASLAQGHVVVGGRPNTFADGLATRHVGDLPYQIIRALGVKAVTVDDRTIARAAFLLLEQAKVLAEGAGATPLAALLQHPELAADGPIVLVVSGGNLDPFLLDRILFIGLSAEGRLLRLRSALRDTPGRLAEFLHVAAEASANVRHIVHDRESPGRVPGEVSVDLELEVRDADHAEEVLRTYRGKGWAVQRVPGDVENSDPS
ncbi:MAG: threonine ammonia-lyase [Thermoplasmata archaeon]|nr:threonine ammonia-lyase [Thermoplasmata archaeon]